MVGLVACGVEQAQVFVGGLRVNVACLGRKPAWTLLVSSIMLAGRNAADKLPITDTPHPVPTLRLDQRKPGVRIRIQTAKSSICQDNGGGLLFRQHADQTFQEALVYGMGGQMASWVNFFVERHCASLDDNRGTQPVPVHVCRQA